MPEETQDGGTPSATPSDDDATSSTTTPTDDTQTRDAQRDAEADAAQTRREAALPEEFRKALDAERRARRDAERELKQLRDAEKTRADAEKTDLERVTERAEAAEARVVEMEREALARSVANEMGIPSLWHRLTGTDVRSLRADAAKLREELGLGEGALDGGVRSTGVRQEPASMDDLIRHGARR